MHIALHPRDDFDRLYVSRKAGEKGLVSIEENADASIQSLEDYIEKNGRRLITATKKNTNTNRTETTRKQN